MIKAECRFFLVDSLPSHFWKMILDLIQWLWSRKICEFAPVSTFFFKENKILFQKIRPQVPQHWTLFVTQIKGTMGIELCPLFTTYQLFQLKILSQDKPLLLFACLFQTRNFRAITMPLTLFLLYISVTFFRTEMRSQWIWNFFLDKFQKSIVESFVFLFLSFFHMI